METRHRRVGKPNVTLLVISLFLSNPFLSFKRIDFHPHRVIADAFRLVAIIELTGHYAFNLQLIDRPATGGSRTEKMTADFLGFKIVGLNGSGAGVAQHSAVTLTVDNQSAVSSLYGAIEFRTVNTPDYQTAISDNSSFQLDCE